MSLMSRRTRRTVHPIPLMAAVLAVLLAAAPGVAQDASARRIAGSRHTRLERIVRAR